MASYPSDARVTVLPFSHQRDGDTVTIGDIDRQVFLAIPAEGLDIIDSLNAGHTVGEAGHRFTQRYGETPDIAHFLDALDQEGFLEHPPAGDGTARGASAAARGAQPSTPRRSWSMNWLSPAAARRLVSAPVLVVCGVIVLAGVTANVLDPETVPTPAALLFPVHFAALTWATVFLALAGVALHEVAHVVAARAAGIPARIGIGNQLYVMVAQTDMSGIWLVPKRRRYLAFVIGSVVDLVTYSVLACVLYGGRHGWFHLPRTAALLITAVMLAYSTRVVWQWFFFLRTDGYYVVATALDCKSLLTDTEDYLYNKMAALRRARYRVDQSAIPAREMRVVRGFAVAWVLGRVVAVGFFAAVGIPVLSGYVHQFALLVTGQDSQFGSLDFLTVAVLAIVLDGAGLALWLRAMYRRARQRRWARAVTGPAGAGPAGRVQAAMAGAREPGIS